MKRLAIAALVIATFAGSASAQVIKSKFDWDRMGEAEQIGYVLGLADQMDIHWVGEAAKNRADVDGRVACLNRLHLRGSDMVGMVDKSYDNPLNAGLSPELVYLDNVTKLCLNEINVERAKYGLTPYTGVPKNPPQPGQSYVHY